LWHFVMERHISRNSAEQPVALLTSSTYLNRCIWNCRNTLLVLNGLLPRVFLFRAAVLNGLLPKWPNPDKLNAWAIASAQHSDCICAAESKCAVVPWYVFP
jgi:hypothetical protein